MGDVTQENHLLDRFSVTQQTSFVVEDDPIRVQIERLFKARQGFQRFFTHLALLFLIVTSSQSNCYYRLSPFRVMFFRGTNFVCMSFFDPLPAQQWERDAEGRVRETHF
jgi:hypothetical protein